MKKGPKLYKTAKKIIPGGTQLLSKRPEMFLPEFWPSYYKKAKDVSIWDLDDNHYFDMSIMGIGSCSLGYSNDQVNKSVIDSISLGSSSSLNCPEEVRLAEELLLLHPFAEMVRFSKTGGEATAIAVRIARAASGKSKVALCGYHGWHDWYLSANIKNSKNLDQQLLPGLKTKGIPKEMAGSSIPFTYGDIQEFKNVVEHNKDDLGVVITEVQRGREVDLDFLRTIRSITDELGIVLIFDEVSSGFRLNVGGLCEIYKINPDIICLGKALGNGFGISAILGKKEIMEVAQDTFISSTDWTERTGYVAGLETIKQFKELNVIDYLVDLADYYDSKVKELIDSLEINITMGGLLTIPSLIIKEENPLLIKTYITQEMLKKGYLASNITYFSYKHTKKIVDDYLKILSRILKIVKNEIDQGNDLKHLIDGDVCHSGFKRLAKI